MKHKCTNAKSGRSVHRSFFYEYVDRVKAYQDTEAFKKAMLDFRR